MPSGIENAENWSSMIKSIEAEKKSLPWDPQTTEPVKRVNLAERKLQERELDPVVMQFRDKSREQRVQTALEERKNVVITRAEQIKTQKFNILNHEGPPRKIDAMPRVEKKTTTREWNLLSHLPHNMHNKAPTTFDEDYSNYFTKVDRTHSGRENKSRSFNIINNQFKENNEERELEEYEATKNHVLKKYWETHNYDFIRGEYYDEQKERDFLDQRKQAESVQGVSQLKRLPPSVLYSEGSTYDIINHEIESEERFEASNGVKERSLNRIKKTSIEKQQREVGEKSLVIDEAKKLNRVSFERWKSEIDRGFDMLTNKVRCSIAEKNNYSDPKILQPPHPSRPASVWNRLTASIHSENSVISQSARVHENNTSSHDLPPKPFRPVSKSGRLMTVQNPSLSPRRNDSNQISMHSILNCHNNGNNNAGSSNSNSNIHNHIDSSQRNIQSQQSARKLSNRDISNGNTVTNRSSNTNSNQHLSTTLSRVPMLNISQTIAPQAVSYVEPKDGPSGLPVAIVPATVRTGGFSNR